MIDVRDLAAWIVTLAEARIEGDFDGVGRPTPIGDLLSACAPDADLHLGRPGLPRPTRASSRGWVPDAVPLWLPRPEYDGMMQHFVEPSSRRRPRPPPRRGDLARHPRVAARPPRRGRHRHRPRPRARAARRLARSRLTDAGLRPPYAPGVIKYLGSKRTLVPVLGELAVAAGARTALDLFTGTTRVAQELKRRGIEVTASDLATYSAVLSDCYVATDATTVDEHELDAALARLDALPGEPGYFTETFCERVALLPARATAPASTRSATRSSATTRRATRCARSC